MDTSELSQKIKQLRSTKGFSQELLAEKSQLSLRTIQRIENGETGVRGDTLKRLAAALEITTEELSGKKLEVTDKRNPTLLNLSALSFLAFPLLGVVVPLVIWATQKDKTSYMDSTGKKLINFQLSWCILFFILNVLIIVPKIMHVSLQIFGPLGRPESFMLMLASLYLLNFLLIIINTIRSSSQKSVFYQPAIPFFR